MVSSGTPRSCASGSSASICVPRIGPTTAGEGAPPITRSQAVTAASGVDCVSSTSGFRATSRIWLAASSAPFLWLVPSSATKPGERHEHGQAHILRRRRRRGEGSEEGCYCAAPPAHGDITSFMPVSSPVAGSRTMHDGLAKPSGETSLPTSTVGSRAGNRLLHRIGQVAVDADRAHARDVDARLMEGRLDVEAAVDQHQRKLRHRRHDAPAARGADAEPRLAVLGHDHGADVAQAAACPARSSWAGWARDRTTACRCSW